MVMFDPFKVEDEYLRVLDSIDVLAADHYAHRREYTREGYVAVWERLMDASKNEQKFEALKALCAEAYNALDLLAEHELAKRVPAVDGLDGDEATAAELKLARMTKRVESAPSSFIAAAKILSENLGTPFAGVWVDEMRYRDVFATGDDEQTGVGAAVKVHDESYQRVCEFVNYGRTLINTALGALIRSFEAALACPTYEGVRPERGKVGHPLYHAEQVRVGTIVADPFRWSLDGKRWEAGDIMNAHRAAEVVRNRALAALARNEEVA